MSWFTHARIFDDLLIVAQKETCCYVRKTDSALARIAYSQSRMKHLPNIYILGERGVQRFCEVYRKVAE